MLDYKRDYGAIIMACIAVPFVLLIIHSIYFLFTIAVIFISDRLFNIDWSGEFWAVYVMVFVFCAVMGSFYYRR